MRAEPQVLEINSRETVRADFFLTFGLCVHGYFSRLFMGW